MPDVRPSVEISSFKLPQPGKNTLYLFPDEYHQDGGFIYLDFPPAIFVKKLEFCSLPQKSNLLPVDHPSFYRLIGNFSVGHRYQPNFWGVKMTSKLAKADEWGYSQL